MMMMNMMIVVIVKAVDVERIVKMTTAIALIILRITNDYTGMTIYNYYPKEQRVINPQKRKLAHKYTWVKYLICN